VSAILPNALTAVLTDSSPDADGFVSLGFRALDLGDFALNRLLSMFAFVVVVWLWWEKRRDPCLDIDCVRFATCLPQ